MKKGEGWPFTIMKGILFSLLVLALLQSEVGATGRPKPFKRVFGRAGSEKEFEFVAYAFHADCSYALSYDEDVFNLDDTSIPSESYPVNKFQRTSVKSRHIFDNKIVILKLNRLTLRDSGVYSCLFTCPSSNISQHYKLVVSSPPEPASCKWLLTSDSGLSQVGGSIGYKTLQCSALQGNPKGTIICYTWNCETVGSYIRVYSPVYVTGKSELFAQFWIEYYSCIDCCSVSETFSKTRGDCQDFTYISRDRTQKYSQSLQPTADNSLPSTFGYTLGVTNIRISPSSNENSGSPTRISVLVLIFSFLLLVVYVG